MLRVTLAFSVWVVLGFTFHANGESSPPVVYHYDDSYDYNGIMQGSPPPKEKRVTLDSFFDSQAKLRWAHQNMRQLYPTQRISRGCGPVTALGRTPKTCFINSIQVPMEGDETITVEDLLFKSDTDAFLMLHDGQVVTEQYFHGMKPDTHHYLWSASKSVSACVVAALLGTGTLDEDGSITKYVPELVGSGFEGATIRQLLDMESGVSQPHDFTKPEYNWTDPAFRVADHVSARFSRAAGLFRKLPGESLDEGGFDFLPTLTKDRPHGEMFYYKDPDSRALAWACEKVTGKRFADLVSEMIWSKLGPEHDAHIRCDVAGAGYSAHGITVTLRDFARWGQMLLDGCSSSGERLVPKNFLDDIVMNHDPNKMTADSFPLIRWMEAYRSQFWIPAGGEDEFLAGGAFGQMCYVNRNYNTVIVKFSTQFSTETVGIDNIGELEVRAFREIAQSLAGHVQ
jgi:CubicO group peptidase (beta-lactamase class C family)